MFPFVADLNDKQLEQFIHALREWQSQSRDG